MTAEGRISPYDVGLYSDANERALESTLRTVRACTPPATAPFIALQLGHAGRKGSGAAPWRGGAQISPEGKKYNIIDRRMCLEFEDLNLRFECEILEFEIAI